MPKLLIDEPPLLVIPSLAAAIGLPEAIFLQQLHYWIDANGHLQDDGRRWIFNSYESWSQQFPWWNVGTIRRIVATLRDAGIIATTTKYNRMGIDHTLWYTIDYTALDALTNPPPQPTTPPEPAPPPDPPDPPAENDTSSAENDRRSAQNEQTIRAKCTDDPRILRGTITRDLPAETSTETSTEDVVVEDDDHSQDHIALEEKTRAPARATPPDPSHPSPPGCTQPQPPALTYETANTHPPALHAALAHAEIYDPDTRQGILHANPDLTVEFILAWDTQRTRSNTGLPPARQMGAGALAALLRTGQPPPTRAFDPAATETWLTTHGYLPTPDDPDPPIPQSAPPIPTPPAPAADLWRRLIDSVAISTPNLARILAHYPVQATLIDDTLTITTHPELVHHLTRPHSVLPGILDRTLTYLANRPITLTVTEASAP